MAQNKFLSSRGSGVPLLLNPSSNHPSSSPSSPPVAQLWPRAAHENSHQIILTKHQHLLLGDTPFITHTCIHTCSFTYRRSSLFGVIGAHAYDRRWPRKLNFFVVCRLSVCAHFGMRQVFFVLSLPPYFSHALKQCRTNVKPPRFLKSSSFKLLLRCVSSRLVQPVTAPRSRGCA